MRGVVLGGVLSVTLAAGAVLAAGFADTPRPADPPRPPEMPAAVARDAEEQQPKKTEAPSKLGAPHLTRKLDLNLRLVRGLAWSPDGKWLAVQGTVAGNADGVAVAGPRPGGGANEIAVVPVADPAVLYDQHALPTGATVVGFTADGHHLLVHTREGGLISGANQLQRWAVGVNPPGAKGPRPTVGLDPLDPATIPDDSAAVLTPSPSNKTTLRYLIRDADKGGIRKVAVWTTDVRFEARWPNGSFEGTFRTAQLTPDANRVVVVTDAGAVEAYDLEGKRAWATGPAPKDKAFRLRAAFGSGGKGGPFAATGIPGGGGPNPSPPAFVAAAASAPRLLAVRGWSPPVVLDADTGKALPALEGVDVIGTSHKVAAVSADGRLVALAFSPLEQPADPKDGNPLAGTPFGGSPTMIYGAARVMVWDTATGKVVRTWTGGASALAFHPTRSVLAILEPNGTDTRLGFWEFRAE